MQLEKRKLERLTPVECDSGKIYFIATGYGVIQSCQGIIFESMSEETMERMKKKLQKKGQGLEDMPEAVLMDFFSGSDLKSFLISHANEGSKILARCIRAMDGEPFGTCYDDRYEECFEFLDFEDGTKIMKVIEGIIKRGEKGKEVKGKSEIFSQGKENISEASPKLS